MARSFYATVTSWQYPKLLDIAGASGAYVEIQNVTTRTKAIEKMHAAFGSKWSFLYNNLDEMHELDRNCVAILV